MTVGRLILAVVIALSVALLPAVGGAAAAKAVNSSAMAMHDGCDTPADPCTDKGGCTAMAVCAAKCFGYTGGAIAVVDAMPFVVTCRLEPAERVTPHMGSPPFRPPRA
jgi:hypothetical protein